MLCMLSLLRFSFILLAGLAISNQVVASPSTDDVSAEVQRELDALQTEIRAYARDVDGRSIDEARRGEIRSIVADVLADAEARTSFQDIAVIPGWKKGFRLESPDGNFLLKVGGQLQIRFVMNRANGYAEATPTRSTVMVNGTTQPGGAAYEWGLENRRVKLQFEGHVIDPSWTYRIKGSLERITGGRMLLQNAWIAKSLDNGIKIKVGQFKPAFMREEMVSSSKQLAVDRSLVNEYFNQGNSQGIEISWKNEDFKLSGWTGDGLGSRYLGPARTNGQNTSWDQTATSYSFATRGEWKMAGEWSQFKDMSSRRGSEAGAMLGLAAAVQRANQNIPANGAVSLGITTDLTVDVSGASFFVSGTWANVAAGGAGGTNNPWGVTIQGGYFVMEDVEAFARYEYMDYDLQNQINPKTARFSGFTLGSNWFLTPAVKLTADWTYNFDSLAAGGFQSNGIGLRRDRSGEVGQWALRGQLQLLF